MLIKNLRKLFKHNSKQDFPFLLELVEYLGSFPGEETLLVTNTPQSFNLEINTISTAEFARNKYKNKLIIYVEDVTSIRELQLGETITCSVPDKLDK